jgi:hypothetical protein
MQSAIPTIETSYWRRRLMGVAVALGLMSVLALAQAALAQTTSSPLGFRNNYFVTGNYVVAGVGLRGLGDSAGYANGRITMPDANSVPPTGVPAGAQVVAAFLYWQTVESSQTTYAGQTGYFGPSTGPAGGYRITGTRLGNPNAPVAWSSGGCSGNAQGSKTIRTYRADVLPFLPVDSDGNVSPGTDLLPVQYEVHLRDSGSNGGGTPLTLGATLVIIYRILDSSVPLNSIVIYDGTFAQSNTSSDMTQKIEGFYEAAAHPIAKLTEIVGNGQPNKYESVSLNGTGLTSLYGDGLLPPFPGYYDQGAYSDTGGGSWDNPTWSVNSYGNAVQAEDSTATATVMPSASNSGCVSWGAVILSTTVEDTDNDGLLDKWETDKGYCDASVNNGVCTHNDTTDPGWVSLPDAHENEKDIYVQMDYMCRNPDATTCDATDGSSFLPRQSALDKLTGAFAPQGINLHLIQGNVIPQAETACTDDLSASPPRFCPVPNQPGEVAWKGGFAFLKNQPLNYPDESSCEQALDGPCIRRFQHGRKDSYHYALFGNALDAPSWSLLGGNLTSVVASGAAVTFNTTTDPRFSPTNPTGVVPGDTVGGNGRVTVSGAVSNFDLNGTFYVTGATATSFTIHTATSANATYTSSTDPHLTVASGQAGTISGASDVDGEDSAITLGSWGADGESANVQAGIFMHELGHTLGLAHGGTYYSSGSYDPTFGPNCKPNYQSVMNYLFTVDLLGPGQTLDYSEQSLNPLDESSLAGAVTAPSGSPTYSTTKWYAPSPPGGVGTKATVHCDGTPIDHSHDFTPTMYLVEGDADPISPVSAWQSPQDITFNGSIDTTLRGYDDWTNIDLRQIGAAGSLSTAGGPIGIFSLGPIGIFSLGPVGIFSLGPVGIFSLGPGRGEITHEVANSVTRPPRNLTATVLSSPVSIQLTWDKPTFGQIGAYKIYRGVDSPPGTKPYATISGSPPATSYTDTKKISCGHTYTYFVTAVLARTSQESVASNTVTVTKCVAGP